jgi:hypothetical protein
MTDPRYPIGPFEVGPAPDFDMRLRLLSQLAEAPSSPWLKSAIDAAQDWIQSV